MIPWLKKTWRTVRWTLTHLGAFLRGHWRAGLLVIAGVVLLALIIRDAYLRWGRDWVWATWADEISFGGKTIWNWLELLVIPAFLALAALFFNRQERQNEWKIAENRTQDTVLQNYLDKMGELILEKQLMEVKRVRDETRKGNADLHENEQDKALPASLRSVRDMAQVRTVTVLRQLNSDRRNIVLQFLRDTDLAGFLLAGSSLSGANLSFTNLSSLNLNGAKLFGTDQIGAYLNRADLREANLRGAKLIDADLIGADLSRATVNDEQLTKVKSLEGATMPDGRKFDPTVHKFGN